MDDRPAPDRRRRRFCTMFLAPAAASGPVYIRNGPRWVDATPRNTPSARLRMKTVGVLSLRSISCRAQDVPRHRAREPAALVKAPRHRRAILFERDEHTSALPGAVEMVDERWDILSAVPDNFAELKEHLRRHHLNPRRQPQLDPPNRPLCDNRNSSPALAFCASPDLTPAGRTPRRRRSRTPTPRRAS